MPSTTLHNSKTTLSGILDLSDQPGARSSPRNEASGNSSAISVTLVSSGLLHAMILRLTRSQSRYRYQAPSYLASPHSFPCSRCRPSEQYNSSFPGRSSRRGAGYRVELSPCHLPIRSFHQIRSYLRGAELSANRSLNTKPTHHIFIGRSLEDPSIILCSSAPG
jgi:hypothetical protein